MSELKRPTPELINLANDVLSVRNEINADKLSSLFSEVTLIQYNLLKRIWSELPTCTECPKTKITLQEMQAKSDLPMNRISQAVTGLNDAGLVSWERGKNGTYITLTSGGYDRFRKQEQMLLSYLDNVIDIIGMERFKEILAAMGELESALNQAEPAGN